MEGYIQTGIGILVSILLFLILIGYKQTIGAKKERVNSANIAVHKAILRRMFLEDYQPKLIDMSRLIKGKAREFRVNQIDLLSEEQILIQLFTEVFDNELISPNQRKEIEVKLNSSFEELKASTSIGAIPAFAKEKREYLAGLMALLASMAGAIFALITTIYEKGTTIFQLDKQFLLPAITSFLASLLFVSFIAYLKKSKENQTDISSRQSLVEGATFENEIAELLTKLSIQFEVEPQFETPSGVKFKPDFLIMTNDRRIAIGSAAWSGQVPLSIFSKVRDSAKIMLDEKIVDNVLLVVKDKSSIPRMFSPVKDFEILTTKELQSYLNKLAA